MPEGSQTASLSYEDRTIVPDIEVPLTRDEIYSESDPILEAALDYLADVTD